MEVTYFARRVRLSEIARVQVIHPQTNLTTVQCADLAADYVRIRPDSEAVVKQAHETTLVSMVRSTLYAQNTDFLLYFLMHNKCVIAPQLHSIC